MLQQKTLHQWDQQGTHLMQVPISLVQQFWSMVYVKPQNKVGTEWRSNYLCLMPGGTQTKTSFKKLSGNFILKISRIFSIGIIQVTWLQRTCVLIGRIKRLTTIEFSYGGRRELSLKIDTLEPKVWNPLNYLLLDLSLLWFTRGI